MKHKYSLLIVAGLAFGLAACNKSINILPNGSPIGKWQETKLRIYRDSSGTIKNDSTYLAPFFTSADFAQFNSDSTCTIGSSRYYDATLGLYPKNGTDISTVNFKYKAVAGSQFILLPEMITFTTNGYTSTDTVSISGNMLHLRSTGGSFANQTIFDAWYTKQ